MKVVIGGDHAGYLLKEELKKFLKVKGIKVFDVGTNSLEAVDYPEYAEKVATLVSQGKYPYGILVCGSGLGVAITANKVPGIRAASCYDIYSARLSREHNDANVLALGARLLDNEHAQEIVEGWLNTEFLGGRHSRRVKQIGEIERKYFKTRIATDKRTDDHG